MGRISGIIMEKEIDSYTNISFIDKKNYEKNKIIEHFKLSSLLELENKINIRKLNKKNCESCFEN
jgi:hypothetical protein